MWKTGFYAVIEEFRKRIKQAKDAGPPAEENLRKVCTRHSGGGTLTIVHVVTPHPCRNGNMKMWLLIGPMAWYA